MAWTTLLTNQRWGVESPALYFDLYYDSYRSVNSMYYKTKISIHANSSPFAEEIYVKFYLDNVLKLNNYNIKPFTPTTWASTIEYESGWYEVTNKISGTTKLDYWLFSQTRLYNYIYYLPVLGAGSVLATTINDFTIDSSYGVGNAFPVTCAKYDASYYDVLYVYIGSNLVATRNNYATGNFTFTNAELITPYTGVYALMAGSLSKQFTFNLVTFVDSNKATQVGNGSVKYATGTITNYGSTLNAIPYFTLDSTEGVGNPFAVSVNKGTSTNYDVLTIKIGANTVATRDNYSTGNVTFTNAELITATTGIYARMPSSRSATFTFELKSYTDSGKGTQVGTTSTVSTVGTIATYLPTINSANITHLDSNATTVALTGSNQKFIQGHSDLQILVNSKGTTYKGATLGNNAYQYIVSGQTTQYSNESDSLNFVKTFEAITTGGYALYLIDSRSVGAVYNKGLSFTNYSNPTISSLSITRLNGSAEDIYIAVTGTYTDWTGLSTTNSIQTARFRYKEVGGAYGSYTNITLTTNTGGSFTKSSYNAVDLDITKDYEFEVEFIDRLESVTQTAIVIAGTGTIVLDISNKSLGIGKTPDASVDRGSLDIAGGLYFDAVPTFGVQLQEQGNNAITSAGLYRILNSKVEPRWGIDTETVFESNNVYNKSITQIDANTYLIFYNRTNWTGYIRLLTISDGVITVGNATTVSNVYYPTIAKLDTNKAIILYNESSNNLASSVVSVSGTTVTVGDKYTSAVDGIQIGLAQINTDKALACYADGSNSNYGTARVLSASGTVVSFGSAVVYESAGTSGAVHKVAQLDTDKGIVCFRGTSNYARACAMTVATATITAGTTVNVEADTSDYLAVTQITTDKAIVAYYTSVGGRACTLNVSTRTITPGTPITFTTNIKSTPYTGIAMLNTVDAISFYRDNVGSYPTTCKLTTSGTSTIVADTPIMVGTVATAYYDCALTNLTTNEMLLLYGYISTSKTAIYKQYDATGYVLGASFSSNDIEGRSDSLTVVPYVPLS